MDLLLPLGLSFCAGAVLASGLGWAAVPLVPVAMWLALRPSARWLCGLTVLSGLAAGWLWTPAPPTLLQTTGPVRLVGRLLEAPRTYAGGGLRATGVVLVQGGAVPAGARLSVLFYCDVDLGPGDLVRLGGQLVRPQAARNPGGTDRRARLRDAGLAGVLRVRTAGEVHRLSAGSGGIARWCWRLRGLWMDDLTRRYRQPVRGVLMALLLGEQGHLDEGLRDELAAAGLAHLVAISGLHLGLVGWLVHALLLRLTGRALPPAVGCALVLVCYAVLTGLRPPAVRALAVTAYLLGARLRGRPADPAGGFGWTLVASLVWSPRAASSLGFQLSFGAILGIVALRGLVGEGGGWVARGLRTSLTAWLGTLPVAAHHLDRLAPAGLVLSPLLIPPLGVLLTLGWLDLLTGGPPGLSRLVGGLARWLLWMPAEQVAGLRTGLPAPGPGPLLAGALVAALLWRLLRPGPWTPAGRAGIGGLTAVVLIAALGRPPVAHPRVDVLDVGHGLAVLVSLPGGEELLFDAGSMARRGPATTVLLPALRARGVRRLTHLVLSHADRDHVNGALRLARAMSVGTLWTTRACLTERPSLLRELAQEVDQLRVLEAGVTRLPLRAAQAQLWVPPQPGPTRNQSSLVLWLEAAGHRVLLTGDLEGPALARLMADQGVGRRPPVDLLVLPHHGNPDGGLGGLLRVTRPRLVVNSAASTDPLPDRALIRAPLLETGRDGAVGAALARGRPMVASGWRGRRIVVD